MKPLNELFEVTYGNKLDLNKLTPQPISEGGVNFVGRSSKNHGVSATVEPVDGIAPYEAGLITVALGGSKLLTSFIQEAQFYTAQNVAVLRPKQEMTFAQKLYICLAIRHNRFRYSAFGREANRTLRTLPVPALDEFPDWIQEMEQEAVAPVDASANNADTPKLVHQDWRQFSIQNLFEIRKGQRLTKADMLPGRTPFIGASDANNGITTYVGQDAIHEGNTISVSYNGSVGEAFYQPEPYWASDDINALYPKGFELTPAIALFICTVLRQEQYRFNFGRKWPMKRMNESVIKLPVDESGKPDWAFMAHYIETLSYSSQL